MIKFLILAVPILYGFTTFKLSSWRTKRHISSHSSSITDPEIQKLNALLAKTAKLKKVNTKIYEIAPINGLVLPDGKIYITRGLMNCYEQGDISAKELSTVIAHELGHLMLGHTKGRLADFAGQNFARMALGFLFSRFIPFLGNFIAQIIITLFSKRMSKVDEFAADAYASALLTAAGIGTEVQKSLLRKLPKLSGKIGPEIAWMMRHPKIKDRIAEIEKREKKWRMNAEPSNQHDT